VEFAEDRIFGTGVGWRAGMKGVMAFHQESNGGRRKNEGRPLGTVSALCFIQCFDRKNIRPIHVSLITNSFSSGTGGTWWMKKTKVNRLTRFTWKTTVKTDVELLHLGPDYRS